MGPTQETAAMLKHDDYVTLGAGDDGALYELLGELVASGRSFMVEFVRKDGSYPVDHVVVGAEGVRQTLARLAAEAEWAAGVEGSAD